VGITFVLVGLDHFAKTDELSRLMLRYSSVGLSVSMIETFNMPYAEAYYTSPTPAGIFT